MRSRSQYQMMPSRWRVRNCAVDDAEYCEDGDCFGDARDDSVDTREAREYGVIDVGFWVAAEIEIE